jgi:protein disulfide-isomerase A6
MILLVGFFVIIVVIAMYMMYTDVRREARKLEQFDEPKLKVILFHATWCGHCVKYLASDVFLKTYHTEVKNSPMLAGVVFEQLDYDKNKELADKYDVSSFPSIVAVSGKGVLVGEFKGDRYNKDELIKFASDSLKGL